MEQTNLTFSLYETISKVQPQRPRNGLGQSILKITFLKSLDQMEKNGPYFGFVVKKKSKSVLKGGVIASNSTLDHN